MKTYIKSILLGTGLFSLLSCSDFLDQSSPSELKGENVFNSVVYTEQALNKVYADLTYATLMVPVSLSISVIIRILNWKCNQAIGSSSKFRKRIRELLSKQRMG